MKKVYIGILMLFCFSLVVALDFPHTIVNLDYTGNLTNLSEMQDVNIPSPTEGQALKYSSATAKWIAGTVGAVTGNCSAGTFVQNVTDDKLWCAASSGSGDITAVYSNGKYLTGGGANGDIYLLLNETILNSTIDSRAGSGGYTQEEIEDFTGAMTTGNTETYITVTYQDVDGTIDYVVTDSWWNSYSDFMGTTTTAKWCVWDGTEIDCNVEPVTDTNTQLSEATVDGYCDNNNYLDLDTYPNADTDSTNDFSGVFSALTGTDTNTCGAGDFVTNVTVSNGNLIVICGTPSGSGDITSVTAGNGLNGGGTSGAVTLTVNSPSCSSGEYSRYNGTGFQCYTDSDTGSGGASKWLDGGDYIYPNSTYANNVYINGELNITGNNMYIGDSNGVYYIYFYDDGSPKGEYIRWHNETEGFLLSGGLSTNGAGDIGGTLEVDSDFWTSGTGDDFWLGTATQSSSLFKAFANGSLSNKDIITTDNITAGNYFVGDGSFLTNLPAGTETDPYWTANYSAYNESWSLDTNTQLSEATVDGYCDNNGYLTSYTETDPYWSGNYTAYNDSWSLDTNTQLTQEQVEDYAGGMDLGTETRITVTYNDATGNIDYVVDDMNDDLIDDNTPQLSGNLDANGYNISVDAGEKFCLNVVCSRYMFDNGTGVVIQG